MREAQIYQETSFMRYPISQEVAERLAPYEESITLLTTIPGVSRRSATSLISELGTDLAPFPSAAHACFVGGALSWQPASVQASVAMENRLKATATSVLC